ncbi:MAG TPA: lysylphosphatidylglycerol synthase transmembrane domain-containing protein [Candidatus Binatia bacterium]|nr:lysylphosphatidylglycerol synthase transmembrane domain-containing protein [Candidatus Binatia bacterium]
MRFLSSRWFKAGVSLGLLALVLRSANLHLLLTQVLAARLEFFLPALAGYVASQGLSAYKWQVLARPLGFDQPLRAFLAYYFVGMYLNLFAPSTVLGDLARGLLLARDGGGIGLALQSVLADRLSGMLMLLWVSAVGFLSFGPTVLPPALCYGVIAAACLLVVVWWLLPSLVACLGSPHHRLRQWAERALAPYRTRWAAVFARACGLAFVFHLFQLALQVLIAHALSLSVPFWYLMLFIPLVHMLSALPLSFGGVGVREGGYVVFLAFIGIDRNEAVAFGLLWTALVFGSGLVGGLVLLVSPATRLSLQFSAARDQWRPRAQGTQSS